MAATDDTRREASLRAKAFYDAELRSKLELTKNGKYIVIDGESLDYEVAPNLIVATVHLRDRRPVGPTLALRIGHDTTLRLPLRQRDSHSEVADVQTNARQKGEDAVLPTYRRNPASLLAETFYNTELRAKLEPAQNGKFIVIAGKTHDYEVDSDPITAAVHLQDRQPGGEMFIFRVGYDSEQCVFHSLRFSI